MHAGRHGGALAVAGPAPRPLRSRRVLLAASQGGHLQELATLRSRVVPEGTTVVWLTSASPQARLLAGDDDIVFVRHAAQRDIGNVLLDVPAAVRALVRYRPTAVVSTGAAVALAVLPAARALGVEAHYIESAARTEGPSLTGRLVSRWPGTYCYTQWQPWAHRGWRYAGSVFDGLRAEPRPSAGAVQRLVVTLGTQQNYGFTRLIRKLLDIMPASTEVFWQVREADAAQVGIVAHPFVPTTELAEEIRKADVVVAHAGVGSALTALQLGKCPVLVPRQTKYGEHVDDHQGLVGAQLQRAGLAVVRTVEDLSFADLELAANRDVRTNSAPPLRLGGRLGESLSAA